MPAVNTALAQLALVLGNSERNRHSLGIFAQNLKAVRGRSALKAV
jgi:hypothetical protein